MQPKKQQGNWCFRRSELSIQLTVRRAFKIVATITLANALSGCGSPEPTIIEGRPQGPYRMTFEAQPANPAPQQKTLLTERITLRRDGTPVRDLQVLHERVIHNFIVNLNFTSFAHIHHEDFAEIGEADLNDATLRFPYAFPGRGRYRIVSEFTHRNRSWTKHFDIAVGDPPGAPNVQVDLAREISRGRYRASLSVSPTIPVAGFETELVLKLARDDKPVTDLELILGSEAHVALWRTDGQQFGHTHSYTPHMAAMMARMHDRTIDPQTRAKAMTEMMIEMSNMPSELVFKGPHVPLRFVFAEPGTYAVFVQCAPGGTAEVFDFMLEVEAYRDGMTTDIDPWISPSTHHAHAPL
ncbi:MAG: hypothetical protein ACI9BW_004664 [Gammaproteobacteria bacterium]|jgi:hypothetical protein